MIRMKYLFVLIFIGLMTICIFKVYSACTNCHEKVSVWRDSCSEGGTCQSTIYYTEGLACCDGAIGSATTCPTHMNPTIIEIYSISGSCTDPHTVSCASTGFPSACTQKVAYSFVNYGGCSLGAFVDYDITYVYFCD
jgi:hypothetical protein